MEISNKPFNEKVDFSKVQISVTCNEGNKSSLACNNPNCKEYAFVCDNKLCKCRTTHKKCLFTCPVQIFQVICQKRKQSKDVIDKVSEIFDKWIDYISKVREEIQSNLSDWGLSASEKKFIELISNSQYKELTGFHINKITSQTTNYFEQDYKELILSQIQNCYKNYDKQIQAIMNTFARLFQTLTASQMNEPFKMKEEIIAQKQSNFISQFEQFSQNNLRKKEKYEKQDFQKFVAFVKNTVKRDFFTTFNKFKKERRVYGSTKLREKYFQDYFFVLSKGQKYITKWQTDVESQIKHINKSMQPELSQLCKYYRECQTSLQKPFTSEIALSLQKCLATLSLLTDYVKQNGKQMLRPLVERNKTITENVTLAIYFLDGLMDDHPEIDQIQVIWNIVRFEQKVKSQFNLLYETLNEVTKQVYHVQV